MAGHRFELVGGDPSLDFLNTIHDWTVPEARDYLPGFPETLRFAAAAGVLARTEARQLARRPARDELRRLRELRARLERIFRAAINAHPPPPGDLGALARDAVEAARAARLRPARRRVARDIDVSTAGASVVRFRIVEAAVSLLTSARLERVKACPSCGWFFLDASKNRSRRWCRMSTCGSSAKARRYYWRTRRRRNVGEGR